AEAHRRADAREEQRETRLTRLIGGGRRQIQQFSGVGGNTSARRHILAADERIGRPAARRSCCGGYIYVAVNVCRRIVDKRAKSGAAVIKLDANERIRDGVPASGGNQEHS